MASPGTFPDPDSGGARRWLPLAIGVVVVLGIAWFLYGQLTATTGVKVEAPSPLAIQMVPPPPPPPPPPPVQHPPEPQDKPNPMPNPVPNPVEQKSAPAPVSINGPAQAGSDAFGLQSGNGGGQGGTGTCTGSFCGGGAGGPPMSEQFYTRYIDGLLTEKFAADKRLNRQAFGMDVSITVSPTGRITLASVVKSSGRSDRDQLVKEILLSISDLDPPPAGMRFPQRFRVKGKRPV
jgi:TonB family protein